MSGRGGPMTPERRLIERLRELALVDVDVLVGRQVGRGAAELIAAFVADLEDALGRARALIRETHTALGAGPDPLVHLDRTPELRSRGGEAAVADVAARLAARAQARRCLAEVEVVVEGVLPRLLEADRRLTSL